MEEPTPEAKKTCVRNDESHDKESVSVSPVTLAVVEGTKRRRVAFVSDVTTGSREKERAALEPLEKERCWNRCRLSRTS